MGTAHCGACHETFTSVAAFDKHRSNGKCLKPNGRALKMIKSTERKCERDGKALPVWTSQRQSRAG